MSKKVPIKNPQSKSKSSEDWVMSREGIKRLTIEVPLSLHTRLKLASIRHGRTMGNIIRGCLEEYLTKNDKT